MAAEGAGVDQSTWWKGLAAIWEDNSLVRSRIHRGDHLLLPDPEAVNKGASEADIEKQFTDKTMMNLRYNVEVLEPALQKWAENDPTAVPLVDDLSSEVEKILHLCNRDHPGEEADDETPAKAVPRGSSCAKSLISPLGAIRDPSKDLDSIVISDDELKLENVEESCTRHHAKSMQTDRAYVDEYLEALMSEAKRRKQMGLKWMCFPTFVVVRS
ncbi:unnamed protein product [Symbiodinium sp. CCMP2592]|nr:unnamed protein product [Symbiodinium sp. CCMP2592]